MMSPLLVLATGWVLVGATGLQKREVYRRFENGTKVVTEDTVFQSPARDIFDCGILCMHQDDCEAFTFDENVCMGHSIALRSRSRNRSGSGVRLFVKQRSRHCSNYTVLDDWRRDVNTGNEGMCDDGLTAGWYRFLLNGTDAVMPTQCVADNHCGTFAPYWLDLQGGELPAVGEKIAARACTGCLEDCGGYGTPVFVRNCGAFYLYKLQPSRCCVCAYCAKERS